jgi:5'-nucleotidase / UDP-sugar diphosphatase
MNAYRLRRLLVLTLLIAVLAPARDAVRSLTILHFNDFHAAFQPDAGRRGGLASLGTAIRREQEGCKSCLLLVAGDLVQGSPVSTVFRGVPVYEVANRLKIDAATLGNHEFDYGWELIPRFIRIAKFPIVDANITDDAGKLLAKQPYRILKVNGIRVGVLGVTTADLPKLGMPEKLGPWHASNVVAAVHKYAPELRRQSDVIVVLAHLTGTEEDQVLHEAKEAPVIISGHVHFGLDAPKTEDGRMVVRVRANGLELGRLDLRIDTSKKTIVSSTWKRIAVNAKSAAPAPDLAQLAAKWEKKVSEVVDVVIGESRRTLLQPELRVLIEKATAEEMGTDFAYMNKGGVRAQLPAGTLLARHVWNVYPFDNLVVVAKVKGSQLPPAIKAGRVIDPDKEYTLAVNDFAAAHQESELGVKGLVFTKTGPAQRDVLINWIKKKKLIE